MEVRFDDDELDRLEVDKDYTGRYAQALARSFRKTMGWIRAAADERDFYAMKGLHFEKLAGRTGQYSMRLNDQFRLIVKFEEGNPRKTVVVIRVEDYH